MQNWATRAFRLLASATLAFGSAEAALSLSIHYGSDTQRVSIVYGKETIFRFDEPVKTLSNAARFEITPADETSPDYSVMKVRPRYRRGKDEVNFILANGAVVRVAIATVAKHIPEKTHSIYDFAARQAEIQREIEQDSAISQMQLLKAMIRDDRVAGYTKRRLKRGVLSGSPNLKIALISIYTGAKYNGYTFKVTNTSTTKSYDLKLENLSIGHPNTARLAQTDLKELKNAKTKKNSTLVRVVASATATYYNVNLPFKQHRIKQK